MEYKVVIKSAKLFNAKTKDPIIGLPIKGLSSISHTYEKVEAQENPNIKKCNMCDTLSENCRGVRFSVQLPGFDQEIRLGGYVCEKCYGRIKNRSERN